MLTSTYHRIAFSALLWLSFNTFFLVQEVPGQFVEITSDQGISIVNSGTYLGNGIAFCDVDFNGFDDLTFGGTSGSPIIYLNYDGNFELASALFPTLYDEQIKALLWFDYDNDADRDLFLSYWSDPVKLLRNDGNLTFTDVTSSAGLLYEDVNHFGASCADVDRDGFLDLYLCKYSNVGTNSGYQYTNRFYHNNGDGTFSDHTITSGLGGVIKSSFQSVFLDFNNDSWPDLYVINDKIQQENLMFVNDGDGTFSNVTFVSGAGVMVDAMTATVDDYDRNGFLDIYITNNPTGNVLLRNNGNGTFTDYAPQTGTELNIASWGSLWLDYDNDTWLDLFVGTTIGLTNPLQNYFLINSNGILFTEGNTETNISGDIDPTYSVAMGDLNNDGYFDYATNNNNPYASSLWLNDGGENSYLSITLEGTVSNKDAIGTWVECFVNGDKHIRYSTCGENYLGQNSFREIFGIDNETMVDSLTIKWPSGLTEKYSNVEANQHIHLVEGASLISGPAEITFSGDLYLCPGDSLICTLGEGAGYTWNSGQQSQSIVIYEPGTYQGSIISEYGLLQSAEPFEVLWAPVSTWQDVATNPSCYGVADGSAEVIFDMIPISFQWNNGETSLLIGGLGPDTLWWNAINEFGCAYSDTMILVQPDSLSITISSTDPTCFGLNDGNVSLTVSGGTGNYEVQWSDNIDPESLLAGTYAVEVNDENGCVASQEFTLYEPEELILTVSAFDVPLNQTYGSAEASVTGGSPPYSVLWSSGESETWSVDQLFADDYFVIVTDSAGCADTAYFSILVGLEEFTILSTPCFFPNPADDYLEVVGSAGYGEISIFSQEGQLVKKQQVTFDRNRICRISLQEFNTGLYQIRLQQKGRLRSGILIKR